MGATQGYNFDLPSVNELDGCEHGSSAALSRGNRSHQTSSTGILSCTLTKQMEETRELLSCVIEVLSAPDGGSVKRHSS